MCAGMWPRYECAVLKLLVDAGTDDPDLLASNAQKIWKHCFPKVLKSERAAASCEFGNVRKREGV